MTTTLSIALVTRNRPLSLQRTLESLRDQSVQPDEIVISDDSDQMHSVVVRILAEQYGCRYVWGPHRGLYANRNNAAVMCAGNNVRTVDDDHTFPPGHVAICLAAIEASPETVWVIGECQPGTEAAGGQWICPGQLHPRGYATPPRPGKAMWAIADGATIYPRAIFDRGLRYYEGFVLGASYLEWGSRLCRLGYDIRHLSETYVVHHVGARSYNDEVSEAASRLFAGLSHSFLYQPTRMNRFLALSEIGIMIARMKGAGLRAGIAGIGAFREHRRQALLEVVPYPFNSGL